MGWGRVCKLLQIEKSRRTPYHPGLVEKANDSLLSMLSTVVGEHKETWEALHYFLIPESVHLCFINFSK